MSSRNPLLSPRGHDFVLAACADVAIESNGIDAAIRYSAIRFTNEGSIHVTTGKNKSINEITVSVNDTGSGLDPEIIPRLFSKFATKSDKGAGLGTLSKSIIEAHGGRIGAENNTYGKGATFTFSLPISGQKP